MIGIFFYGMIGLGAEHVEKMAVDTYIAKYTRVLRWFPSRFAFLFHFKASLSKHFSRVLNLLLPIHGWSPRK